jgi:hypothetical protein
MRPRHSRSATYCFRLPASFTRSSRAALFRRSSKGTRLMRWSAVWRRSRRVEAVFHQAPFGIPSGWSTYERSICEEIQSIR